MNLKFSSSHKNEVFDDCKKDNSKDNSNSKDNINASRSTEQDNKFQVDVDFD